MTTWKIEQNDVIEWAKNYNGQPFHAALLDPPYHLVSINKRFSKPGSKPPKGGVYKRTSAGFMGSVWDSVDEKGMGIAFDPATWVALSLHLYPGAFIMAFASSRGWHRMAVAMEDSGLVLHPSIFMMGWNYLSGFPKATRINGYGSPAFSGHRYGLQALKPALEPIIVAQVPYGQRPVDSIVATGAGALNIDGGRIATGEKIASHYNCGRQTVAMNEGFSNPYQSGDSGKYIQSDGRWPSNFLLSHSPLCNGECHPDCPVRLFDEQAGERTVGGPGEPTPRYIGASLPLGGNRSEVGYGDSGPASRMFHQASFEYESIEANAPLMKLRNGLSEREKLYVTEELKKAGVL